MRKQYEIVIGGRRGRYIPTSRYMDWEPPGDQRTLVWLQAVAQEEASKRGFIEYNLPVHLVNVEDDNDTMDFEIQHRIVRIYNESNSSK